MRPQPAQYSAMFVGIERPVPVLGGVPPTYTNFANAASTPALKAVQKAVDNFLPYDNSFIVGWAHHSNDLPWRAAAEMIHIRLLPDGRLDLSDFDARLRQFGERIVLMAVSGASNVTGNRPGNHRSQFDSHVERRSYTQLRQEKYSIPMNSGSAGKAAQDRLHLSQVAGAKEVEMVEQVVTGRLKSSPGSKFCRLARRA